MSKNANLNIIWYFLNKKILVQYLIVMSDDTGWLCWRCWINSNQLQAILPPTMPLALTRRASHQWQKVSLSLSLSLSLKLNVSPPINFIFNDFLTRYDLELHVVHVNTSNQVSVVRAQFYQIGEPDSFLSKVKN